MPLDISKTDLREAVEAINTSFGYVKKGAALVAKTDNKPSKKNAYLFQKAEQAFAESDKALLRFVRLAQKGKWRTGGIPGFDDKIYGRLTRVRGLLMPLEGISKRLAAMAKNSNAHEYYPGNYAKDRPYIDKTIRDGLRLLSVILSTWRKLVAQMKSARRGYRSGYRARRRRYAFMPGMKGSFTLTESRRAIGDAVRYLNDLAKNPTRVKTGAFYKVWQLLKPTIMEMQQIQSMPVDEFGVVRNKYKGAIRQFRDVKDAIWQKENRLKTLNTKWGGRDQVGPDQFDRDIARFSIEIIHELQRYQRVISELEQGIRKERQ